MTLVGTFKRDQTDGAYSQAIPKCHALTNRGRGSLVVFN